MSIVLLWMATQIIVESFPVSSSSHIKLLEIFLEKNSMEDSLSRLPAHFDDFLHGPTLFILALFFFNRWYFLLRHCVRFNQLFLAVVGRTLLASCTTVAWYFIFQLTLFSAMFPMVLGLLITTGLLFSLRWTDSDKYESYTFSKALILGCVQGLALLPGISRLASTYVIARWLKLTPRHALEASFAMQAPLIVAAFVRGAHKALLSPYIYEVLNLQTWLVMIISSVIAYGGLYLVMYMARNHKLWLFGYYMIVPLFAWLVLRM